MKIHFFIKVANCLSGLNLDFLLQSIGAINIIFFHHQKPLLASNNRVLIFILIRNRNVLCMSPEVGDLSIKNMFCRAAEKGKEGDFTET